MELVSNPVARCAPPDTVLCDLNELRLQIFSSGRLNSTVSGSSMLSSANEEMGKTGFAFFFSGKYT